MSDDQTISRHGLLTEAARRASHNKIAEEELFPAQLAFVRDPSKRKALFTPRRSGKSTALAIMLLQEALAYPKRNHLYIGLSADQAHRIVFQIIDEQCRKRKIAITYNHTSHVITFRNGSTIKLMGMESSPRDMAKVLGGKYHMVIIDETQSFTQDLRVMIDDMIAPAVTDFIKKGGGIICLAGTPGLQMGEHVWFKITRQLSNGQPDPERMAGWALHEWNVTDNPHMAAEFGEECERQFKLYGPSYQDLPSFRRQWLGKWILDPGHRVYKFNDPDNVVTDPALIKELLSGHQRWTYVMGVDLGWEDATALVLAAYCRTDPNLYVVTSEKMKHTVVAQLGGALLAYKSRFNIQRFIIDTSGMGKQLAESMRSDFALPIYAADRREKENNIGRLNSDFLSKRIQVITEHGTNAHLINEWNTLTIDRHLLETEGKWRENPTKDNHLADAFLYAFKDSLHHHAVIPEPPRPQDFADQLLARKKRTTNPFQDDEDIFDRQDREAEARDIVQKFRVGQKVQRGWP